MTAAIKEAEKYLTEGKVKRFKSSENKTSRIDLIASLRINFYTRRLVWEDYHADGWEERSVMGYQTSVRYLVKTYSG